MIHPSTKLKHISNEIGYGVFATEFIPEGTIIYVKDAMELEISAEEFAKQPKILQEAIDKYSYVDSAGFRILSWDLGKYVNHCCDPNTMSTGYGFEIAIKDIFPDDQITDEYGLFNLSEEMQVLCGKESCRKTLYPNDIDNLFLLWDQKIMKSLPKMFSVDQPLYSLIDRDTIHALQAYKIDFKKYWSVRKLKFEFSEQRR